MKLLTLPEENLLSVANFLSVKDIYSLSSTCHSAQAALMESQAAKSSIWLHRMNSAFSEVFRPSSTYYRNNDLPDQQEEVSQVSKKMSYKLVKSGYSGIIKQDIDLPLITSLLPQRYPQSIDQKTLKPSLLKSHTATASLFRSIEGKVPVIQFVGEVGSCTQCIRSDKPFPSNCPSIMRKNGFKSGLGFIPGISTWIKKLKNNTKTNLGKGGQRIASGTSGTGYSSLVSTSQGSSSMQDAKKCGKENSVIDDGFKNSGGVLHCFNNEPPNNPRPFIVPTARFESNETCLSIDVTPRLVAYFEVTIMHQDLLADSTKKQNIAQEEHSSSDCIAIGLATKSNPLNRMPGWDSESYGYHSDDGNMFSGKSRPLNQGPVFGPGDIVGCGLEYTSRRIFFTKNGKFLGFTFPRVKSCVVADGLYPVVGLDTNCPVFTNFGAQPFKFDLSRIKGAKVYKQQIW